MMNCFTMLSLNRFKKAAAWVVLPLLGAWQAAAQDDVAQDEAVPSVVVSEQAVEEEVVAVKDIAADAKQVNAELLVVQGTPGEEGYAEDFGASVALWKEAGEKGVANVNVIGPESEDQREKLRKAIAGMQKESPIPLWIVLVGHGTFNRRAANFNLAGEDVSALDFGEWLEDFKRPIILIHGGAASAPYIRRLSREGRVIITATQKGGEINYTRFGTYMARALQSPESDLDNDGQASVYECFLHAARQTNAFYETNGLLATEHALIDDNGDGRGSGLDLLERFEFGKSRIVDGDYARLWSLVLNEDEMMLTADQRSRRNALESKVLEFRRKRSDYADASAFFAEVEPVLLEIARIYAENENTEESVSDQKEAIAIEASDAPPPVDDDVVDKGDVSAEEEDASVDELSVETIEE